MTVNIIFTKKVTIPPKNIQDNFFNDIWSNILPYTLYT